MAETIDGKTYVSMMIDSLKKKADFLDEIFSYTKEQDELLRGEMDVDRFMETTDQKGDIIDKIDKLDNGFDSLYGRFEREMIDNRNRYAAEIGQMKSLISRITDMSTNIQVLEKRNHEKFQKYISDERSRIKEKNASQQTAMTYAKNMLGAHKPGNSYFVNETK